MNTTTRHWFRCLIPDGPDHEGRVGSLKDWAEFLAKSADVPFSIDVSNGNTVFDLSYIDDEAPRQFATRAVSTCMESALVFVFDAFSTANRIHFT
jgi:hypothetical protein